MSIPPSLPVTLFEQATGIRRVLARLLDFLICFISFSIITGILGALGVPVSLLVFIGLFVAYDTVSHHLWGKTIGKRAAGTIVVDKNGKKLSWGMSLLRTIVFFISLPVLVFVVFLMAAFTGWIFIPGQKKYPRYLHETMSKSFVARESKGQLKQVETVLGTQGQALVGPAADLEKLRAQGFISDEEYQKKHKELKL